MPSNPVNQFGSVRFNPIQTLTVMRLGAVVNLPWSEEFDEYSLSIGHRVVVIRCEGWNSSTGGSSGESKYGK
jgi:hypothetical protein